MPYLELQTIYDKIDFKAANHVAPNPSVLNNFMDSALVCPSDSEAGLLDNFRERSYTPCPAGCTQGSTFSMGESYVPSGGPLKMTDSNTPCIPYPATTPDNINCKGQRGGAIQQGNTPSAGAPGMFAGGPPAYRFKDCTDGLSKTLLVGESLPIYSTFRMYFASHMNVASTNPPPNNHLLDMSCPKSPITRVGDCYANMGGYMSQHPGGFQGAMSDGSVQFITETIDYTVYQFLGDKADGQTFRY